MIWKIYRKLREPVNGLMHLAAAVLALLGLVGLLILGHNSLVKIIALLIYGISLVGSCRLRYERSLCYICRIKHKKDMYHSCVSDKI